MAEMTTVQESGKGTKLWEISVNRKPVFVEDPLVTGLQIKEVAIAQGVSIAVDFQLASVDDDGKHRIVGDSDKVDVREFKTFFATARDDNS